MSQIVTIRYLECRGFCEYLKWLTVKIPDLWAYMYIYTYIGGVAHARVTYMQHCDVFWVSVWCGGIK